MEWRHFVTYLWNDPRKYPCMTNSKNTRTGSKKMQGVETMAF